MAGAHFPSRWDKGAELIWVTWLKYWGGFARPKTVNHPSTSRGGRESDSQPSSRDSNALTTGLPSHQYMHNNIGQFGGNPYYILSISDWSITILAKNQA